MPTLYGAPYPVKATPLGYLPSITNMSVLLADLKQLILTNPGERVMLPSFGTPLKQYLFQQNDSSTRAQIVNAINVSIGKWDPRIIVNSINVYTGQEYYNINNLSGTQRNISQEELNNLGNSLILKLEIVNPDKINQVDVLELELPLSP
jgi:phage baseplate assembly protein W